MSTKLASRIHTSRFDPAEFAPEDQESVRLLMAAGFSLLVRLCNGNQGDFNANANCC